MMQSLELLMSKSTEEKHPSLIRWSLSLAATVGFTSMLCCVAPMVLFMFGLMGGVYAISFADFFYDGNVAGAGAWTLRGLAIVIGGIGIRRYHLMQKKCSIDPKRQRINLTLIIIIVSTLGLGFFYTLESASSWYFNMYIVPAQQLEFKQLNEKKEIRENDIR